jgi:hypothetical protein
MDKWLRNTLGIGFGGLFVLLAANGEKFWQAAEGAVRFMVLLADKAPFGVGSFALALALGALAQAFLAPFVRLKCPASVQLVLMVIGFAFGCGAMVAQLPTLNGVLLGLMAGFAAPFFYQLLAAAFGLALRATSPEMDP